jgi:hypothetical protein
MIEVPGMTWDNEPTTEVARPLIDILADLEHDTAWRAKWDATEHPRVPGGEHGGEFAGKPSTWFRTPPALGSRTHEQLVQDALDSWKGDTQAMRTAMDRILRGEPGRNPRVNEEAAALLAEIAKSPPNPVRLYRGVSAAPPGWKPGGHPGVPVGWTSDRRVARKRAGKTGRVMTLDRGAAPALHVTDWSGAYTEEDEWIAVPPSEAQRGMTWEDLCRATGWMNR